MSGQLIVALVLALLVMRWLSRRGSTSGRMSVRVHGHGDIRDRKTTARHEAGHAVAARALGGWVLSARMWDGGGLVQARIPGGAEEAVTFLRAGALAAGTSEGAEADAALIRRELRSVPSRERAQVKRDAERAARRIVSSRSGQISRDARTLERKNRL